MQHNACFFNLKTSLLFTVKKKIRKAPLINNILLHVSEIKGVSMPHAMPYVGSNEYIRCLLEDTTLP